MSVLIGFDVEKNPDENCVSIRAIWDDANGNEHTIIGIGDTMEEAGRQFEFAARQIGCPLRAPQAGEWFKG